MEKTKDNTNGVKEDDKEIRFDQEAQDDGLDFDFNFDEFETKQPSNAREAITQSVTEFGSGFVNEIQENKLKHTLNVVEGALPDGISKEYDDVKSLLTENVSYLQEESNNLRKEASKVVKEFAKLAPDNTFLQKWGLNLANWIKPEEYERAGVKKSKEEKEQEEAANGIIAALGQIQNKQEADAAVANVIASKQHADNLSMLKSIYAETKLQRDFHYEVTNKFYRKHLEMQYRSYFLQKELVEVTKAAFDGFKNQFESIVKNTGLPDIIKVKQSELLKGDITRKLREEAAEKMYKKFDAATGFNKRVSGLLKKGVSKSKEAMREAFEQAEGLKGIRDMFLQEDEFGGTRAMTFGGIAAGIASKQIGYGLKHLTSDNDTVKKAVAATKLNLIDPRYMFNKAANALEEKFSEKKGYSDEAVDDNGNYKKGFIPRKFGILGRLLGKGLKEVANYNPETESTNFNRADLNDGHLFDGRAHTSIVKVIPGLLTKIYAELKTNRVGGKPEQNMIYWDSRHEKFVDGESITTDLKTKYKEGMKSSFGGAKGIVDFYANNGLNITEEEKRELATIFMKYYASGRGLFTPEVIFLKDIRKEVQSFDLHNKIIDYKDSFYRRIQNKPELVERFYRLANNTTSNLPRHDNRLKELYDSGHTELVESFGLTDKDNAGNLSISSSKRIDMYMDTFNELYDEELGINKKSSLWSRVKNVGKKAYDKTRQGFRSAGKTIGRAANRTRQAASRAANAAADAASAATTSVFTGVGEGARRVIDLAKLATERKSQQEEPKEQPTKKGWFSGLFSKKEQPNINNISADEKRAALETIIEELTVISSNTGNTNKLLTEIGQHTVEIKNILAGLCECICKCVGVRISDSFDKLSSAFTDGFSKFKNFASEAKDRAEQAYEQAKDKAGKFKEEAKTKYEEAKARAQSKYEEAKAKVDETLEKTETGRRAKAGFFTAKDNVGKAYDNAKGAAETVFDKAKKIILDNEEVEVNKKKPTEEEINNNKNNFNWFYANAHWFSSKNMRTIRDIMGEEKFRIILEERKARNNNKKETPKPGVYKVDDIEGLKSERQKFKDTVNNAKDATVNKAEEVKDFIVDNAAKAKDRAEELFFKLRTKDGRIELQNEAAAAASNAKNNVGNAFNSAKDFVGRKADEYGVTSKVNEIDSKYNISGRATSFMDRMREFELYKKLFGEKDKKENESNKFSLLTSALNNIRNSNLLSSVGGTVRDTAVNIGGRVLNLGSVFTKQEQPNSAEIEKERMFLEKNEEELKAAFFASNEYKTGAVTSYPLWLRTMGFVAIPALGVGWGAYKLGKGLLKLIWKADRAVAKVTNPIKIMKTMWSIINYRGSMTSAAAKTGKAVLTSPIFVISKLTEVIKGLVFPEKKKSIKDRVGSWFNRLNLFKSRRGEKGNQVASIMEKAKGNFSVTMGITAIIALLNTLGINIGTMLDWTKKIVVTVKDVGVKIFNVGKTIGSYIAKLFGGEGDMGAMLGGAAALLGTGMVAFKGLGLIPKLALGIGGMIGKSIIGAITGAGALAGGALDLAGKGAKGAGKVGSKILKAAGKTTAKVVVAGTVGAAATMGITNASAGNIAAASATINTADLKSKPVTGNLAKPVSPPGSNKHIQEAVKHIPTEKSKYLPQFLLDAGSKLIKPFLDKASAFFKPIKFMMEFIVGAFKGTLSGSYKALKYSGAMVSFIKKNCGKFIARIVALIAVSATGFGAVLTACFAVWELGWMAYYYFKDNYTVIEAFFRQLLDITKEQWKEWLDGKSIDEWISDSINKLLRSEEDEKKAAQKEQETIDREEQFAEGMRQAAEYRRKKEEERAQKMKDEDTINSAFNDDLFNKLDKELEDDKEYRGVDNIKFNSDKAKSNFQGLHPELQRRVLDLADDFKTEANRDIQVNSTKRSIQEQEAEYRADPKKAAAPNPYSPHVAGVAIDIPSVDVNEAMRRGLLDKHGLWAPLHSNNKSKYGRDKDAYVEDWHVEMKEARPDAKEGKSIGRISRDSIAAIDNKFGKGFGPDFVPVEGRLTAVEKEMASDGDEVKLAEKEDIISNPAPKKSTGLLTKDPDVIRQMNAPVMTASIDTTSSVPTMTTTKIEDILSKSYEVQFESMNYLKQLVEVFNVEPNKKEAANTPQVFPDSLINLKRKENFAV